MSLRCIHIADVHFRGLKRHDEYKKVFTEFFVKAKELSPDIIFIGGDIVHSKTQGISPELIDILSWWFTEMSNICDVHVILGNHDGLILNKDRQDAITPIVSALGIDNIFLYKNSGTYSINKDFNFCVFSCFDEENWSNVKPEEGKINIATFHGGVLGSKTDSEWNISGEVSESFFSEYDFTFLGDIHKYQYIDKEKRIAYPGSTIQQNYGEDVKKGFILWEINSKWDYKSTFVQLKNPYAFYTVEWKSDYETTIASLKNKPKFSRFRVKSDTSLTQAEIRLIHSYLKEEKLAKEIVFKIDAKLDTATVQNNKLKTLNLWDASQRKEIINSYFLDTLDDEMLNNVNNLFSETIDEVPEDHVKKPVSWSLKNIKFNNTFSYGKNNEINLDKTNGIIGIFAKNASGKSSIPGTIMYTLFNGTDRGSLKNLHVINSRKGSCSASALIESNNTEYLVSRKTEKKQNKKGDVSATTYLDLHKIVNGIVVDESEEQRRETEKVLREIVGNSEDFLMTSFASQGSINSFIKEKASARKSILTKFIGLDIFDELHKISRDKYNLIKGSMMSKKQRNWNSEIEDFLAEIDELEIKKVQLKEEITQLKEKESKIRFQLSQKQSLSFDIDIESLENKKNLLESSLNSKRTELINLEDKLENLSNKKSKINNALSLIDIESLYDDKNRLEESKIKLNTLLNELSLNKKDIKQANEGLEILNSVPCTNPCIKTPAESVGIDFTSCKFISRAYEKGNQKSELIKNEEILSRSSSEIKSFISELEKLNINKKIKLYENSKISLKDYETDEKIISTKIHSLKENISRLEKDYEFSVREHLNAVNMLNKEDEEVITSLKNQLQEYEHSINIKQSNWAKSEGRISFLQDTIQRYEEEREEFEELNEKYKTYDIFSTAMSKKGIPVNLIKDMLPVINKEIKSILNTVVPFTVELEIEDGSNSMDVYINYGDSKRIIECGSGMEKMISSIAIRVALINISSLPKSDIFIIDEGFGALDETNLEACSRLLQSLKKWFKTIMIISHVDAIKDIVDDTLEITTKEKDSYVKY